MSALESIQMPYSREAEQTVIGAVLTHPDALTMVTERIKTEHFYIEQHRRLYDIILRMFTSGNDADVITVLNEALAQHVFDSAEEGRNYLMNLAQSVPTIINIQSYCAIIINKYHIRMLAETAQSILDEIQEGETNAQQLLDSAEQKIFNIREGRNTGGLIPLRDIVTETYIHIANMAGPDREKYLGIRSGFAYLDSLISGLNKSDLILIAARPAMGKTAFALNIAENVAKTHRDQEICIFSLEMSRSQLASRLLSASSKVDANALRNGRLSGDDWTKLALGASYLSDQNIFIDDTAGITVPQIKARLLRMKHLGLVIIDYLGLIESTLKTENKAQAVAEITRQLKVMAKELNIPVIALSQLSRGPESRTDKRPMLSDLRDSGSIEQDADIVMFLYRDAYYNKQSQTPNIAECIVAKNRHGETGTVRLTWDGQYTRFSMEELKDAPP